MHSKRVRFLVNTWLGQSNVYWKIPGRFLGKKVLVLCIGSQTWGNVASWEQLRNTFLARTLRKILLYVTGESSEIISYFLIRHLTHLRHVHTINTVK